jgi:hypothetical protein
MKYPSHSTPTVKHDGRIFRNDLIFILSLLAAVFLLGLAFFLLRGEGDTVTVTVDGESFGTYPLSEDRTVEILTGEREAQRNLLIIRDGKAYMAEASCPDGICTAHRPISRRGESIVCLPHRVVVTVRTAKGTPAPDITV